MKLRGPGQKLVIDCFSGEVEDEYHFLFHCNKLENDRNLLLKEIAKSCPNFKRLNSKHKLVW